MSRFTDLIKREPTTFLFGKLWKFSAGRRGKVVLFILLFLFSNLVILLQPLIFAELLNEIQENGLGEHNISYLLLVLSLFVVTTIAFWAFHGIGRIVERTNAFHTRVAYREYLMRGILDLDLSWHGVHDSGDTIDKVDKASRGLYHFADTIFIVLEVVIRIIGTATVLYFFNPYIGLAVLPFVAVSFVILFQFDRRLVKQYKNLNLLENKIAARIFDALSNVTSVVILNVVAPILRNLRRVMMQPFRLFKRNIVLNEIKWFTGSLFFDLLVVLPLGFYLIYAINNDIAVEVGTLSALYLYLSRLSNVFFTFGGYYEDIIVWKTEVQNVAPVEEVFEGRPSRQKLSSKWKGLEVKGLSFAYEDAEHHIKHLEDISFRFKHGERIALIGESGSGKTTFLKVLHGLYPTARAEVTFDGDESTMCETSFSDINLETMLVPQEPELFSASVRENITFGVGFQKEEVENAVALAQFSDVVAQLPRGLKSAINEKGVNLSGGQKQRLALARALLFSQNKKIILLDESTSSVDPKNEVKIYENIFDSFAGKTVLASIHKMNLLKYFDRIIIFESGKIVDDGTFEQLLDQNEGFRKEWENYVRSTK